MKLKIADFSAFDAAAFFPEASMGDATSISIIALPTPYFFAAAFDFLLVPVLEAIPVADRLQKDDFKNIALGVSHKKQNLDKQNPSKFLHVFLDEFGHPDFILEFG